MFYSSSKRITALLECSPKVGDTVYLAQWMCKKPLPVNRILEINKAPKLGQASQRDQWVHSYLKALFTEQIPKSSSVDYKLTAAATKVLTEKFTTNEERDIRQDRRVGLRYLSVADMGRGYNTVLDPSFATERLSLTHVMKIKIISRKEKSIEIDIIDNANYFANGKIHWQGNKNKIPEILKNRNRIRFNKVGETGHGHWELLVRKQTATKDYLKEFLLE